MKFRFQTLVESVLRKLNTPILESVLEPDELDEWLEALKTGNDDEFNEAAEKLLSHYNPLIQGLVSISNPKIRQVSRNELISLAQSTVTNYAAITYNPIDNPGTFATFITGSIKNAFNNLANEYKSSVRVPKARAANLFKLKNAESDFEIEHGRKPTDLELSKILLIKPDLIQKLRQSGVSVDSIDATVGGDDDREQGEFISSTTENPETELMQKEENQQLLDAIAQLPEKQSQIIKMSYGIGEFEDPMTLREIGTSLGMSFTTVKWNAVKAQEKLKAFLS